MCLLIEILQWIWVECVDSYVDQCVVEPGGATTGYKQDSDIGQNLTIDPIEHTGTLELVDESDSDSIASSEETSLDTPCSTPCSELERSFYVPTPQKPKMMPTCDLGNKVFVCQSSQIQKLIDGINAVSVCNATTSCPGKLVPVEVVSFGMGGTLKFQCSGCGLREVFFNSSAVGISGNRYRSTLGVALQVAFVCSGCMYAHYFRTLCLSLGMSTVREPTFFETLKLMYPHVEKLRSKQCEEAKQCMKSLGEATLGRAVTTGDAACLTKGHHSRNATYTLRNKLTNEVLYYTHMCQGLSELSVKQAFVI